MIDMGYIRINRPDRTKFYVPRIGKVFLKRKQRTATEAKGYAEKVNARYESLRKCAASSLLETEQA